MGILRNAQHLELIDHDADLDVAATMCTGSWYGRALAGTRHRPTGRGAPPHWYGERSAADRPCAAPELDAPAVSWGFAGSTGCARGGHRPSRAGHDPRKRLSSWHWARPGSPFWVLGRLEAVTCMLPVRESKKPRTNPGR